MDSPLRFASCTAFHLSLWRKVGLRTEAETVMAATSSSSMSGSYSFASSIFALSGSGTVAGESASPLGSGGRDSNAGRGPIAASERSRTGRRFLGGDDASLML